MSENSLVTPEESVEWFPILSTYVDSELISLKRKAAKEISDFCCKLSSKMNSYLPLLLRLLKCEDSQILCYTCTAIGHLIDGSEEQVQVVIDSTVCPRLVELLMNSDNSVKLKALYALSNITTGSNEQNQIILNLKPLPGLEKLIYSTDLEIKRDAIQTLANFLAGNENQIQEIISANILPKLMHIHETSDYETRLEIARAINNMVINASSTQIHYMVLLDCLPILCEFLSYENPEINKKSLKSLEIILKTGKKFKVHPNPYALIIDDCGGRYKIIYLQSHQEKWFYTACFRIIQKYFNYEHGDME